MKKKVKPSEQKFGDLTKLTEYHFSHQSLPTKWECVRKYFLMLIAAGGGLAFLDVTNDRNNRHGYSGFTAVSNLIGTTFSAALIMLQSVDLAKKLLFDMAGYLPKALDNVVEVPPLSQRRKVQRRTFLGALLSGVPFLIIALDNPLPDIQKIASENWRDGVIGLWATYVYFIYTGFNLLPVALLQNPRFSYYRPSLSRCCPTSELDKEIKIQEDKLNHLENLPKNMIADRVLHSLNALVQKNNFEEIGSLFDSKGERGVQRLISLIQYHMPEIKQPQQTQQTSMAKWGSWAVRLLGAQLQLGAGFSLWTNVFPTFVEAFQETGMAPAASYTLSGILGALPSYTLIVVLAFFGETQVSRLVDYVINGIKKICGKNSDFRWIPPEAELNPLMSLTTTLVAGYIAAFASAGMKAVNEDQYADSFPAAVMRVLDIYADVGIGLMAFVALLDLYYRYQREISAVFGSSTWLSQQKAHLLLIREELPNHIRRLNSEFLREDLLALNDLDLGFLLGPGKNLAWLKEHDQQVVSETKTLEDIISKKTSTSQDPQEELWPMADDGSEVVQSQRPVTRPSHGYVSQCVTALFNCFRGCCRSRPDVDNRSLLGIN